MIFAMRVSFDVLVTTYQLYMPFKHTARVYGGSVHDPVLFSRPFDMQACE